MIYIENAGDFTVPLSAVEAVQSEKVVLNCGKLDKKLRHAIGHAHDAKARAVSPDQLPGLRSSTQTEKLSVLRTS